MTLLNYAIRAVSNYAHRYVACYVWALLGYLCGKHTCPLMQMKIVTSGVRAAQTARDTSRVPFMQNGKHASAFRANQMHAHYSCKNDSHDRRITSRVYTSALEVHVDVINLSCTRSQYRECFQKRVEPCSCHTRV